MQLTQNFEHLSTSMRKTRSITFTPYQVIFWFLAGALFLVAWFLRVHALGLDDLWNDEIAHLQASIAPSWKQMLLAVRVHQGSAPFDYMLLRIYYLLTGADTEVALRLPYTIYGALAVVVMFAMVRALYGMAPALFAAIALAFLPSHIRYSQEVRFYAMSVLLALISAWLFLRAMQHSSWKRWLLWGVSALAGLYTVYAFIFVLLAQGLYLLMVAIWDRDKWRSHFLPAAVIGFCVAILFAPWFWWDLTYDRLNNGTSVTTIQAVWAALIVQDYRAIGLYVAMSATLLGAFLRREGWLWVFTPIAIFFGAIYMDNLSGHPFYPRQLLSIWPFLIIGSCGAMATLADRRKVRPALLILAPVLCALLIWNILPILQRYYGDRDKATWKQVVEYLAPDLKANDTIVTTISIDARELKYYVTKANPNIAVRVYKPDMQFAKAGNTWLAISKRRAGTGSNKVLADLANYGLTKELIGNIYVYKLSTQAERMKPIDPATLPKAVALVGNSLVITDVWSVRKDSTAQASVNGATLSMTVVPGKRARAIYKWVEPLDISQHHTGVLEATVSPGCALSLELETKEDGAKRPIASWRPEQRDEIEFPIIGTVLTRIYLLLDTSDPNVTTCSVDSPQVTFKLDERLTGG